MTLFFDQHPWMDQAACTGKDPSLFFPQRGASTNAAKAICATCPVKAQCLEYSHTHGIRHGVWGGSTGRGRRHDRRLQVVPDERG